MNVNSHDLERMLGGIARPDELSARREELERAINAMIVSDFDGLLQLLYRLDIDEAKLRRHLKDMRGEDAATIITDMIVDRQLQKIKSRQQFSRRDDNISEEDRW